MKKHRAARAADPHHEREALRYEHPIPSREFVLQTLAEAGVPLTDEELAQRLAIRPEEREPLEEFLHSRGLGQPQMFPMVRARITAINSRPSESIKLTNESGRGFLEREQNLTWSAELMEDNQLIAGSWWSAADANYSRCSIRARSCGSRKSFTG